MINLDRIKSEHDIAMILCDIAGKEFNCDFDHSETIFNADTIEDRSFVDVLLLLLFLKSKQDYETLTKELIVYTNCKMRDIPNCLEIFKEFVKLIGE